MDPAVIGEAVSVLLASKFGEGLASEAGKTAWEHVTEAWNAVMRKFGGDPAATKELERLAADPSDQKLRKAVAERVATAARLDEGFRSELAQLVAASRHNQAVTAVIAHASDNAKQINIGGDFRNGSISL